MGLFSTLLHNNSAAEGGETVDAATARKSSGASGLPTVVQLFARRPLPLTTDTAAAQLGSHANQQQQQRHHQPPSYAALHYTAVQCLTELTGSSSLGGASLRGTRHKNWQAVPDLGVWNAKVDVGSTSSTSSNSTKLLDSLLSLTSSSNTYCMVVDLSTGEDPSTVEPTITKLQEALVRLLIQRGGAGAGGGDKQEGEDAAANASLTQTTSLYDLRSVQFGLGDKDEASAGRLKGTGNSAPDEADRNVRIALQICVKQPAPAHTEGLHYKGQQIQKVLLYHLRKYAAALNASLVYVADTAMDDSSSSNKKMGDEPADATASKEPAAEAAAPDAQQPTVTAAQLPLVWKALAQGKPVWKYSNMEAVLDDKLMDGRPAETAAAAAAAEEGSEPTEETPAPEAAAPTATEPVYSLIYGPDNHNTELIESVLQRNANYQGHWDVSTDSIWKILPPTADGKKDATAASTKANAAGDAAWLTELRESVKGNEAVGLQTPPAKGGSSNNNNTESTTKTPNDAAVSSFFEGLLS